MMKMGNSFKILFQTDQHLNNPKLNPRGMTARLMYLTISSIIKYKPDMLLLGGDWFDRPTSFTSKAGVHIIDAMTTLVSICNKHKVALRVLKGTGTHDGVQNDNWEPIAEKYDKLDFKLYKEVDIFNDLGFNILTIPDSTIPNHHKCEVKVRQLLAERGLDKVDLAFSHGMFTHHLADAGFKVEAHDTDFYSGIVDIVMANGHIHRPSLVNNILTGGSTDRLRQGENHPKGMHLIDIDRNAKTFKVTFIENKDAAIFNSYDIMDEHVDVALNRLRGQISQLSADDIYIRLHYRAGVSIRPIEEQLKDEFPKIIFDSVPNAKDVESMREKREMELAKEIPEGISSSTMIPLFTDKFTRMNIEFTEVHKQVLEEIRDGIN